MEKDEFVTVKFLREAVLHGQQYPEGTVVEIDAVFAQVLEKLEFVEVVGHVSPNKLNHAGATKC